MLSRLFVQIWCSLLLDVVVEFEFEGNRTHTHRIDLCFCLVLDPLLDNVHGENIAFEKEFIILFKALEGLLKGDVFTPDVIEKWIEYKTEAEVNPVRMRPVPLEFELYYDI